MEHSETTQSPSTELFLLDGKLIPKDNWEAIVEKLKSETQQSTDAPSTKDELKDALLNAVKKRIPKNKFAILFSGGIDSSFIAFLCNKFSPDQFTCYTVGLETSPDIQFSQKVAKEYNLNHKMKILTLEEIEKAINILRPLFKDIKDQNLAVLYGVGVVSYFGLKMAKEDGHDLCFAGLGSEEIFAGYQRHQQADNINEECWQGLSQMWARDFLRDSIVASHLKIGVATPYLDKEVILKAMTTPGETKIIDEKKKVPLREIAEQEGLEKEFAWRKKKGAQYGASIIKAIQKLSKKEKKTMIRYLRFEGFLGSGDEYRRVVTMHVDEQDNLTLDRNVLGCLSRPGGGLEMAVDKLRHLARGNPEKEGEAEEILDDRLLVPEIIFKIVESQKGD